MISILNADLSIIGILLVAVSNVVIGMLWYGPLFGKLWMKEVKLKKEEAIPEPKDYILNIIAALLMGLAVSFLVSFAYVNAQIVGLADQFLFSQWSEILSALIIGFIVWLGIVVTSSLNPVIWERSSVKVYAINMGYNLVNILTAAVIVAVAMDL